MPDFPTGVPDIPPASSSETLYSMHGGLTHAVGTNRILTNLIGLAAKVGIGAGSPGSVGAVLRRLSSGVSEWGPVVNADVAAAGTANIAVDKLAHLGLNNILKGGQSGTANVAGPVVNADLAGGITLGKLAGAGAGSPNTVVRSTDGTAMLQGKVTVADMASGLIGVTKLGEFPAAGNSAIMEMSGISNAYRSLTAAWVARSSAAATSAQINLTFETTPGAGLYWYQRLYGAGAASGSQENAGTLNYIIAGVAPAASSIAGLFSAGTITLHEYATAGITFHVCELRAASAYNNAAGSQVIDTVGGVWYVAAPISLIRLTTNIGFFAVGSRLTLYGWAN